MVMMKIDRTWPLSPAEQLKSQLRLAICTGTFRAHHPLPTVKALAAELSLNPNTVAAVYRALGREGLITHHRRGGTRVSPGPFPRARGERELLALADRFIRFAQKHQRTGADALRLIAGRWRTADLPAYPDERRYPLYAFLQDHDHDQA
ncbi:MAG: GntR family transcriptional regulator [Verrucomicrobia bacterium]|nr:GntR family transcriptional regulator [Verrucomicrobiota bacterium]